MRKILAENPRIAKSIFPLTTLSDQELQDALRAVELVAGDGLEKLLSGKVPDASYD